ncbi:MAG TPA: hypothetical protein VEC96_10555 [Anaerolineae bacterium]|nr:hypothetical protein [Anaerolineae bacterium]
MPRSRKLMLVLCWLILAACHSSAKSEADIAPVSALLVLPTVTAAPTAAPATPTRAPVTKTPLSKPTPTRTPSPEPTPTPTPVDWLNNVGRTADNLMYLGNPNAPVTVIDYSDFL